jgi:hypothetical protein
MGNNKRKTNQSKTQPTKTTLLSDILPLPDPKFHGRIGNDLRLLHDRILVVQLRKDLL